MKTSRQRVLDVIQSRHIISVAEICQSLHMTPANARHHLKILHHQGLVEIAGQRSSGGKGRPEILYQLSSQSAGENFALLSDLLLKEFLSGVEESELKKRLNRIAGWLGGENIDDQPESSGSHLVQKLFQAIQRLNELHYQARWEARPDFPRIILGRCPYKSILSGHPELCLLDALLIQGLLKSKVHQTAKLLEDKQGSTYCLFVIESKSS